MNEPNTTTAGARTHDQEFDAWFKRVDDEVEAIAGVGVDDLADWDFLSAFEDGQTPAEVARELLTDEGFEFEEEE